MRHLTLLVVLALSVASLSRVAAQGVPQTLTIPIYLINDKDDGGIEYKIGIMLQLGDPAGVNNGYRMYEFDTGGMGFWAATSINTGSNSWASTASGTGPISISYASGNQFTGTAVNTTITFEQGVTNTGALYTASASTTVGQIYSATNPNQASDKPINRWVEHADKGEPAIEKYFFGDFGMSLGSGSNGLLAIVPQLIGPSNTGFIINIGNVPVGPVGSGTIGIGTLQIGLTTEQQQASSWLQTISMQGGTTSPAYPTTGMPTYQEVLSSGTLSVSDATTGTTTLSVGMVYDTGAPTAVIHTGTDAAALAALNQYNLTDGETSLLLTGTTPDSTVLSLVTGTTPGVNVVETSTVDAIGDPGIYMNTGITSFFGRQVVYNLQDGFVGFGAAVPEPGTTSLLIIGSALTVAGACRALRRRKANE